MAQLKNLLVTGSVKFLNDAICDITGDAGTVNGHTVNSDVPSNAIYLPAVSSSDNGKVLRVVSGVWSAELLPSANGVSF